MKTNTVPSLACKGNSMTLGLTNGTTNYGLSFWYQSGNYQGLNTDTSVFNKNVSNTGGSPMYSGPAGQIIGITTDSSKSGIITDTSSMLSITSKAIIKY